MLDGAVDHLTRYVLPSAADYDTAEAALSRAYAADTDPATWIAVAWEAKRHAAHLAIAIDGLPDRCTTELGVSKTAVRKSVDALCVWPGTNSARPGCIERMRGVANAYKHENLTDRTLPITSANDVLVVGLGVGLESVGVGKLGGVEVIVRDKTGQHWKFLGDAPVAVAAWMRFLSGHGATLPSGPYRVYGLQLHP